MTKKGPTGDFFFYFFIFLKKNSYYFLSFLTKGKKKRKKKKKVAAARLVIIIATRYTGNKFFFMDILICTYQVMGVTPEDMTLEYSGLDTVPVTTGEGEAAPLLAVGPAPRTEQDVVDTERGNLSLSDWIHESKMQQDICQE